MADPWYLQEILWITAQLDAAVASGDSDTAAAMRALLLSRPVTGVPRDESGYPKVPVAGRMRATTTRSTLA